MNKVKECINNNCKNTFYVENHRLHLPLQCEFCANKTKKQMDKYEELKEFLNSSKDIETVRNIAIELLDGNTWQDVYNAYEKEIRKNFN